MSSYYLSPIANNTQTGTSGAPLSGGTINTYQAGTTTPQATYTDNTGGTPQANPITLNTYGLPSSPIWLKGGQAYKFLIKDSLGNTVRTVDTITGINDSVFAGSDGTAQYVSAVAGTNTITGTSAGLVAYTTGQVFNFIPAVTNTGATTLNVNTLGAKSITKNGTVALQGGELQAGKMMEVMYDGTQLQLVGASMLSTSGTSVALSGTVVNFAGIPSWVKRITVLYSALSTNGVSPPIVQIGDSGGVKSVGYLCAATQITNGAAVLGTNFSTGFAIANVPSAADSIHGSMRIELLGGTTWCASVITGFSGALTTSQGAGSIVLSAALDRVRITTVGGVDTFDAGTVNILYE